MKQKPDIESCMKLVVKLYKKLHIHFSYGPEQSFQNESTTKRVFTICRKSNNVSVHNLYNKMEKKTKNCF